MNIITKYILLFDCVNSSFSDRCVRRRKELRKRRGCARFPSLFFFSLSLFNRLVETKSLCYRFPSGCVTACLPCTPSSLAATLSLHFTKDPQFSTSSFFNSSRSRRRRRRRKKKGAGKKKGRNRCNGWSDGWSRNADSFSIPRVSMHTREYKCRKLRILCDRSIVRRIVPLFDRSWTLETKNFDLGFTSILFLFFSALFGRVSRVYIAFW